MGAINFLELVDGAKFPMTKAELVAWCEDRGASEEALDVIQALPHVEYTSLSSFNREIGLIESLPGARMNMFDSDQKA
ncbi:MAG TPA: DUF2795 domain-containing protein [Micavibrio sp.]|nr:DUF2795 domain-containing protein [Micavibrio sp.]